MDNAVLISGTANEPLAEKMATALDVPLTPVEVSASLMARYAGR